MRKIVLAFELLLFFAIIYFISTIAQTVILASGNNYQEARNIASIVLVFCVAPVFLLIFLIVAILLQKKTSQIQFFHLACLVIAALLMFHSWGMHAFEAQATEISLVSVAVSVLGIFGNRFCPTRSQ